MVVRDGHFREVLAKGGPGIGGDNGTVFLEEESQKQTHRHRGQA